MENKKETNIEIIEEIIKETTKCDINFACLECKKGENCSRCDVKSSISDDFLSVKPKEELEGLFYQSHPLFWWFFGGICCTNERDINIEP